jgi:hypothetical protein
VVGDLELVCSNPTRIAPARIDALGRPRSGYKALFHSTSQGVEIEGAGSRLEDDELQGVTGDRVRLEIQDACIIR